MPYYAAACALGLAAGAAFAWVWVALVPPGTNKRYWTSMSALTRDMLRVDAGGEFLRLYKRLGVMTGGYLARNLGAAALGCLPVVVILLTAAAALFEGWDAKAQRLALAPPAAAQYVSLPAPGRAQRTGYCSSAGYCALFAALDFEVVEIARHELPYAVLRADHGDRNPLWPFLSDLEAAFFAAFILSTIAGLLWPSLRKRS
ncbi:MAG: hypothetical protein A3G81_31130 [Betaproteobacteria bacterium RIFCSPLOWO2_12_FULL_65_14]|nr:MAG: hypothetical protein A3G81_31130 [Betaproteobacteria bacterium RIFCSPLOWO2_12_FULL_65_14]